ncbi:response regulator transcription factor [Deinococcus sp. MIMF12]|uniref:Response regulator transcription factor n=1 Tax=Deinococcus rhizophilus TaxID=3049544 RepID=A0ABT7JPJ1_9DEIO|nr:response regulator transcription factor [Deinococcus rhizophilus]MDL2345803.1 response regulator transcription factor [Deinococcus rhizophilus]
MRVLVVEDNPRLSGLLVRGLAEEGYAVDACADGEEAVERAAVGDYDLIVLDVMLPRRDGVSACAAMRRSGVRAGILMLTARDTLRDKVAGLDAGADDYLTKPFELGELLARLRALLRRGAGGEAALTVADLRLDPVGKRVERAGQRVELSAREYALLEFLMRHPGQVLSRARIVEAVWQDDSALDGNVVDVYVSYLRAKLDKPFGTPLLHTVRGMGYVLRGPED